MKRNKLKTRVEITRDTSFSPPVNSKSSKSAEVKFIIVVSKNLPLQKLAAPFSRNPPPPPPPLRKIVEMPLSPLSREGGGGHKNCGRLKYDLLVACLIGHSIYELLLAYC